LRARGRSEPRWGARLLAPAAFLLAATVAILLIRAGLDNDSSPGATRPAATTTRPARTTTQPTTTRRQPAPNRRTYTIQEGDTLDQVAFDHNTTVERLLQLNPTIDPTSLQVGQRIVVPG
jgi:LysM repeat protein